MTETRTPVGVNRRSFLLGIAGIGMLTLAGCTSEQAGPSTPSPARPRGPLPIPPLAEASTRDGVRVFELTMQAGQAVIVPEGETSTWGFNGPMLGPTLRMRRGEDVRVEVRNDLDEATSVHWHGMRLPAVADGGPHQMIEPGESWSPSWTVDQPAATLWYHPHPHGQTERHVYQGLAGMLIVDDEEEAALDLPRDYGVDDIPLIIQDKEFDDTGQLVETTRAGVGMLGSTVLVNGAVTPTLTAQSRTLRLRLLNAATARSFTIGCDDDREFEMIGSDGGLLQAPVTMTRLLLTPGERAEILIHLDSDDETQLRSFAQDLGDVAGTTGAEDEFELMTLTTGTGAVAPLGAPTELVPVVRLSETDAAETRQFVMGTDRIGDEVMDMTRIDEVVTVDTTEVWEVSNPTRVPHNFHIHDTQFQILDIGGTPPEPHLAGWKDTVYLPPSAPVRLIMRFTGHTDPDVPYMYHCHMLWHEDIGMMGQFVVVEPGQDAGTPPASDHDH